MPRLRGRPCRRLRLKVQWRRRRMELLGFFCWTFKRGFLWFVWTFSLVCSYDFSVIFWTFIGFSMTSLVILNSSSGDFLLALLNKTIGIMFYFFLGFWKVKGLQTEPSMQTEQKAHQVLENHHRTSSNSLSTCRRPKNKRTKNKPPKTHEQGHYLLSILSLGPFKKIGQATAKVLMGLSNTQKAGVWWSPGGGLPKG